MDFPRGSQELSRSPFEREGIPATPFFDADLRRERSGVAETAPPSAEDLALLRGPVAARIRADYPDFAERVWGLN